MTYQEAVHYIDEIPKFAEKHTTEHTRDFLKRLGSPQEDQKIIHVAGTNGKGSVCAYLRAMLQAEGNRVGFFTSPHLEKVNERIQLNGVNVEDELFLNVFEKVKKVVDDMGGLGIAHPSYFEFLLGMGLVAFKEMQTDYIVMETGLGGRLDATNSVEHPIMTVITSISLDHTQYLGNTIEAIAFEKAGIMKSGVTAVYDGSNDAASGVMEDTARKIGAVTRKIAMDEFEIQELTDKHIVFIRPEANDGTVWELSNSGIYQAMNASLSIAAMEEIAKAEGREMNYNLWQKAVAQVVWEGRMEEVLPGVYIDGAHNPGAIRAFCESVNALHKEYEVLPVFLFSAVADKEFDPMIEDLCHSIPAKAYVITEIEDARRVPAEELGNTFRKYTDKPVYVERNLRKAWDRALELKEEEGQMYCLGSLYLVGMVKNQILSK